ncbi:MAG: hemerythrin domain-containing protein [Deltaproteobacteria bacterium]|nr:hemerythrin domain-containing protein [Deltaproteobacteria bacterium]
MRHPSLIPLSHDHHHGLALALRCRKQALGQIKPMGMEGLKTRAEEFARFFTDNLVPHFEAEEKVLFPLLRSYGDESVPLIEELLKDHEQMRKSVALLSDEKKLGKLLYDLGDLLERHIRREERELFPIFEKQVTPDGAEAVKKEFDKILNRPER